jgi:hypothetical protein
VHIQAISITAKAADHVGLLYIVLINHSILYYIQIVTLAEVRLSVCVTCQLQVSGEHVLIVLGRRVSRGELALVERLMKT